MRDNRSKLLSANSRKGACALTLAVVALFLQVVPCLCAQSPCTWQAVGGGISGGGGGPGSVAALAVFDDGQGERLFAGGQFSQAGGVQAIAVARWDGISWAPAFGLGGGVSDFVVYDDGTGQSLYAGGGFVGQGWSPPQNAVARWTGSTWIPVGSGFGNGVVVSCLAVFDDGTGSALHAGGTFIAIGGITVNYIAKWNGSSWLPLGTGVQHVFGTAYVGAMAVYDDGWGPALYVGGRFTSAGGVSVDSIARWDGTSWSPVGPPPQCWGSVIFVLMVGDDGSGPSLFAGGRSCSLGGALVNHVGKWDGTSWLPLGAGFAPSTSPYQPGTIVYDFELFDDGTGPALYAGGQFSQTGNTPVNNIAKWDGTAWRAVGSGIGYSPSPAPPKVFSLCAWDDCQGPALYAGGSFSLAGGVTAQSMARWSCSSGPSLSLEQPGGPASGVSITNCDLIPGNEYFNVFSLDLCLGGAGTGPYLGLCSATAANTQFLVGQAMAPLGTPLTHFLAPSTSVVWGPISIPPITIEGVLFDFTGGVLGPISPVTSLTIQ